ncbi:DUF1289 domain-containing protein [Roseicyclus mahoneyensis]|uniref:Fe-S protein YdhL (DUF1289 family) n=1 Tax=Roseicyclus mahoneyensis TaxID=164332 RepID=A0A316GPE1_9RHOB|nr:DUF1289 domain-containing protein [Roseicyclus mahoneyensis]PWK62639.1 hypothetical protein C7455_101668 [Roseicyclus mahoneyensis]
MTDDIWTRDEIESPCIKICVVHPEARICTGCLRSIDEITQWSRMTPEARRGVMAALPDRRAALSQRRGGRVARLKRGLEG